MPITRDCNLCGASYTRPPALAGQFCSKACGYAARRKTTTRGYRMLHKPDHPLATNSPYIPEHRALLWDHIGPGAHPCYKCGAEVEWLPGARTKRGALVVDHRDRDKTNNSLDNLAASCQSCNNRNRPDGVEDDEAHIKRGNGSRLRGEQRDCEHCGAQFVAWPDPRPNRGRFCSRSCARSGRTANRRSAQPTPTDARTAYVAAQPKTPTGPSAH